MSARELERYPEVTDFAAEHGFLETIERDLSGVRDHSRSARWGLIPLLQSEHGPTVDVNTNGVKFSVLHLGYVDLDFSEGEILAQRHIRVIAEGSRGPLGYRPRGANNEIYDLHQGKGVLRTVSEAGGLAVQYLCRGNNNPVVFEGRFFGFVNTGEGDMTISNFSLGSLLDGGTNVNIPVMPGQKEVVLSGEVISVPEDFTEAFAE